MTVKSISEEGVGVRAPTEDEEAVMRRHPVLCNSCSSGHHVRCTGVNCWRCPDCRRMRSER